MYYPYLRGRQFGWSGANHYFHLDDLIHLLKKLAQGREISGLAAYE